MPVFIDSEIGELEEVVVHTPGSEIEAMTPDTAREVLYNEIVPLSLVSEQHAVLKSLLSTITNTRELSHLFAQTMANEEVKGAFVREVAHQAGVHHRTEELRELNPEQLFSVMVTGLKQRKNTISSALSKVEFDLPPLPNLYFMRDGAAVIRDGVVVSSMANSVRMPESLMVRYVFSYHPDMTNCRVLFDGTQTSDADITVEGGDILVARPNLFLIGVSERTTAKAIDSIAIRLAAAYCEKITVIAVVLPAERAAIHLDMVFTLLDYDVALVHAPYVTGNARRPVLEMTAEPNGSTTVTHHDGLVPALRANGVEVKLVVCGGDDPLLQQREQWLSAANVFAFSPGKVIGYDCNSATVEQLSKAGFAITHASDFIHGSRSVTEYDRLFIGIPGVELARGGGGVRCMTMPLRRKPLSL